MEYMVSAFASIIVGILSLIGVVITNSRSNNQMQNKMTTQQAITDERITELTREVRAHNGFAQRVPVIENDIANLKRRVNDLEGYHKPQ